nr:hypothetical protein [Tanacetum cinerariifolium]
MSAKRTSWNEFSSTMESAMICLSTGDLSTNSTKYISPALTQKVFANMRRVGKGCSGVETPLFEGMLVAREPEEQGDVEEHSNKEEQGNADTTAEEPVTAVDDFVQSPLPQQQSSPPAPAQGAHFPISLLQEALNACAALAGRVKHLEHDKVAQDLEILKLKSRVKTLERANKVKTMKLRRLTKVGTSQRIESSTDTIMEDVSNQRRMTKESDKDEDKPEIQETVEVVTTAKLIIEVIAVVSETISDAAVVQTDIPTALVNVAAVMTTVAPVKVVVPSTKRRKRVVIRDPEEESSVKTPTETTSKHKGKGILVEESKPIKKKQQVKLDEAYARKLQEEFNQDIDWETTIEHVKQRAKEEPFIQRYQVMKKRPQTEAQARRNMMMYLKNTVGVTLDFFKGMSYDDIRPIFEAKFNANLEFILKSKEQIEEEESRAIALINETLAQKAAKRRRLNKGAEDVEELKQHLEIVPDEDNDVFTEATPLARKVPVVDYQIIHVDNKPRYKIICADDTHQLPDGQDNVWRNQSTVHGQALVKSLKLLTSCRVHIISFNTTQIILLVERRYLLTKFTLEQMLNVLRLQVEEESEMSLELIRFTRQQLQEGQHSLKICLGLDLTQQFINDDSSAESMNTPSKDDLDSLFRPMYEEYIDKKSFKMPINYATQQIQNLEDSPSTSSINIEEHEAPPIVTTFEEQTSPIFLNEADEFYQEDLAVLDGNTLLTPYDTPDFSVVESSIALDPSNMHEFHQVQPLTHIWTKAHPLEQVIGNPSKPVMFQKRLQTNPE